MKFWGITKLCKGDQSGKTFKLGIDVKVYKEEEQQDGDDGLLFFHTHSLWEAMSKLEKFYECKIYGVLDLQEIEEHLKLYEEDDEYSHVSKQVMLDAIDYAYNKVDSAADYEIYLDRIRDYIDGLQN